MSEENRYQSFDEFWPFYLNEHSNGLNRWLHFIGTTLALVFCMWIFFTQQWMYAFALPVIGYGFAWVGHYIVEKNRPATFTYPLWSLLGDFKMWFLMLTFQLGKEISNFKDAK